MKIKAGASKMSPDRKTGIARAQKRFPKHKNAPLTGSEGAPKSYKNN